MQEQHWPILLLIGRSNVGKSSFINFLAKQKVARCAKKPGATQLLNYYCLNQNNQNYHLIDTPGYGFHVRTNKKIRSIGSEIIKCIQKNKKMKVILLIDCRRLIGKLDLQITELLSLKKIETLLLLTKCDKLNQRELAQVNKVTKGWKYEWMNKLVFHSNVDKKFQKINDLQHFINGKY